MVGHQRAGGFGDPPTRSKVLSTGSRVSTPLRFCLASAKRLSTSATWVGPSFGSPGPGERADDALAGIDAEPDRARILDEDLVSRECGDRLRCLSIHLDSGDLHAGLTRGEPRPDQADRSSVLAEHGGHPLAGRHRGVISRPIDEGLPPALDGPRVSNTHVAPGQNRPGRHPVHGDRTCLHLTRLGQRGLFEPLSDSRGHRLRFASGDGRRKAASRHHTHCEQDRRQYSPHALSCSPQQEI